MKVVTKVELVDSVAKDVKAPKTVVTDVVNGFLDAITCNLGEGNKVTLTGYLSLATVKRKERMGFDPRNKKKIKIPAKEVTKAKLGNKWKNPEKKCCKKKSK